MEPSQRKPLLTIVSPSLDRRHGTERRVVEWIAQLSSAFEIHVYSQRVEDLDLSTICWHRIPELPGPHLLNFIWWLGANWLWRWRDRRIRGLRPDLVFSPGPNCLDADAMSVHIVFAEYVRQIHQELSFAGNPIDAWPRILHRRMYYYLAILLERLAYTRPDKTLILIAKRSARPLALLYGRCDQFPVLYAGLDHKVFNPGVRLRLRRLSRAAFGIAEERFVLLLIGNDWRNKGLPVLLQALGTLPALPIDLLVVGREQSARYQAMVRDQGLDGRVRFLTPRNDVEFFYSAADAYVGPSLEDAFAQPPAEAMACGLPIIVSSAAGVSEIVTDGVDGLILSDPRDSRELAGMIRRLYQDRDFRVRLGEKAAETTQRYTWERNGSELAAIFEEILNRKSGMPEHGLVRES